MNEAIQKILDKSVKKGKNVKMGQLLMHSDKHAIHWAFRSGEMDSTLDQFHTASIGKTFTSVVISQLIDEGRLNYEDNISMYLDKDLLQNLFVYKGEDYQDQVKVKHLLNHSSGAGDWYEDKPVEESSLMEQAMRDPSLVFTPDEMIKYSQESLKAVAPPGVKFHYSDTGYHLLGKLIEAVSDTSFEANLQSRIFDLLGMLDTYLYTSQSLEDANRKPFMTVMLKDQDVTDHGWVCADWSGGGIVSTEEDLLKFMQGLTTHKLLSADTFTKWQDFQNFGYGMQYGYGLLQLNLNKFTFGYPEYLNLWGNWGSISSFMFYNPKYDLYLIGTFNQSSHIRKLVPFLMRIMKTVDKAELNNLEMKY